MFSMGLLGASGASSDFELISSQILSSTTTSVTFSSIPSGYKHLQIRYTGRSTRAATDDDLAVRLNGSQSNFRRHEMYGTGSTVSAFNDTANFLGFISANNSPSGVFGSGVIDMLDYLNTNKNTTIRSLSGGTNLTRIKLMSCGWFNTQAISSIELYGVSGSLVTGSRFSLYGVK